VMLTSPWVWVAFVAMQPAAWAQPAAVVPAAAAWPAVRADLVVTTDWLAAHQQDPRVVVVHVARDRAAYDTQHICGAQFLALGDVAVTRAGVPNEMPEPEALRATFERLGVGESSRIVLHGDNQGLYAARAFVALDYLGQGDRAAMLDGGLEQWKAEGRPTCGKDDAVMPAPGHLAIAPRPQIIASLSEVEQVVAGASRAVLVDARAPKEYSGEEPGENVTRPGHIPGARNVFWQQALESRERPVVKSPDAVRKLYEAAGVTPGISVIVYCRTGVQASHAYFTLKWLGLEPRLYDGSFLEWSRAEGTKVEGPRAGQGP
jgi:thiosulfate/3-mercaptopyruvate sulfurtransferase